MKNYRSFAILFLLLAGCATAPALTSAPRPAAADTPTTQPAAPTARPTTVMLSPTPQPQADLLPILPLATPCNFTDENIAFSPRHTWAIFSCKALAAADGTTTRAVRMDGSLDWSLSFKDSYLDPYKTGDPAMPTLLQAAFIPAGWTPDEQFAYLGVQTSTDKTPFKGYDALFRLDLATGKLTPTLKPAVGSLATSYAFRFSPGGTQLAYVNQAIHPLGIIIYNTGTGAEQRISLDARFTQAGGFVWSPDEKQLVVSVFDPGAHGGDSVILFDLATMKNTYLLQNSATVYLPVAWTGDTAVYTQNYSYPGNWEYLDTQTGAIAPAPAPTTAAP